MQETKLKTPRERFRTVAPGRFEQFVKRAKLLERCASDNYEYTEAEAEWIIEQVEGITAKIRNAFREPEAPEPQTSFFLEDYHGPE